MVPTQTHTHKASHLKLYWFLRFVLSRFHVRCDVLFYREKKTKKREHLINIDAISHYSTRHRHLFCFSTIWMNKTELFARRFFFHVHRGANGNGKRYCQQHNSPIWLCVRVWCREWLRFRSIFFGTGSSRTIETSNWSDNQRWKSNGSWWRYRNTKL